MSNIDPALSYALNETFPVKWDEVEQAVDPFVMVVMNKLFMTNTTLNKADQVIEEAWDDFVTKTESKTPDFEDIHHDLSVLTTYLGMKSFFDHDKEVRPTLYEFLEFKHSSYAGNIPEDTEGPIGLMQAISDELKKVDVAESGADSVSLPSEKPDSNDEPATDSPSDLSLEESIALVVEGNTSLMLVDPKRMLLSLAVKLCKPELAALKTPEIAAAKVAIIKNGVESNKLPRAWNLKDRRLLAAAIRGAQKKRKSSGDIMADVAELGLDIDASENSDVAKNVFRSPWRKRVVLVALATGALVLAQNIPNSGERVATKSSLTALATPNSASPMTTVSEIPTTLKPVEATPPPTAPPTTLAPTTTVEPFNQRYLGKVYQRYIKGTIEEEIARIKVHTGDEYTPETLAEYNDYELAQDLSVGIPIIYKDCPDDSAVIQKGDDTAELIAKRQRKRGNNVTAALIDKFNGGKVQAKAGWCAVVKERN